MGALHDGHGALIAASASEHPVTVVSVFVNPTQFGPTEDFTRYPRTLEADIALAERHGATHVFAPSAADMYPDGYSTSITVGPLSTILEGAIRPGHFDGVATVVAKLFNAMLPHEAYFGQKDYQQTLVIKRLVADLNLPVLINVRSTVREADGLAMSSRNRYLTPEQRAASSAIYRALQAGARVMAGGSCNRAEIEASMVEALSEFTIDYAVAARANSLDLPEEFSIGEEIVLLLAARLGATRLIDCLLLGT
jgi:pantoate--beta-alanine ligase